MLLLTDFSIQRPGNTIGQERALAWLSQIHSAAEARLRDLSVEEQMAFEQRYARLLQRCGCSAQHIGSRGHVTSDVERTPRSRLVTPLTESSAPDQPEFDAALELYDVDMHPQGRGTAARSRAFAQVVDEYFEREFANVESAPSEIIHVTCTGYVSPSGAQRVVARKEWGALTQVTHAYHMGCYAAFPAIRLAAGHLGSALAQRRDAPSAPRRVDIVHTELCSLHLNPSLHSAEQCVVQSLFADGFIRYSMTEVSDGSGFEVLGISEQILPNSTASMGWAVGDFGMQMTLSADIPDRIGAALRPFIGQLFEKAGVSLGLLSKCEVAVHPGGPKIIERVREVLELDPDQVQTSRDVLFDFGNMSSATLPHVWQRIQADQSVAPNSLVLSLAFGPGLTVCGALFRKH